MKKNLSTIIIVDLEKKNVFINEIRMDSSETNVDHMHI